MAIITDIQPQKGNKSRVSVFCDGEFFCGLDKLTAVKFRLQVGGEIQPEQLRKAIAESEENSAFEKAANYLGARPRSSKEIRDYLSGKGYSPEATRSAVAKLTEYGYIDDDEYCRAYIRAYEHKYGAAALRQRLYAKGIDREIIERNLSEQGDQTEAIVKLGRKYLSGKQFNEQKLIAYLLRKGYGYDQVREAVNTIKESDC